METIVSIYKTFLEWLFSQLSAPDIYIQFSILALAFILSCFLYRFLENAFTRALDHLPLPDRLKGTVRNLKRLLIPATTVLLLFPLQVLSGAGRYPF